MKNEIIKLSKKIGIDLIGFTDMNCSDFVKHKYELQEKLDYKCSFQVGDISDKMFTNDKYKEYNTAIVIGVSYPKRSSNDIHLSSCSWGIDYHTILNDKLNIIGKYLLEKGYIYKTFVDNNALDERYLAYKAGLGFYGKNNLLINEKLGSYFFIGVILTNLVCEYDEPIKDSCKGCNKCINSCPTKALSFKGILNAKKCLSYINQKKNITEDECKYLNNCIYGCDICSEVCPHNKKVKSNNFKSLNNEIINSEEFLNMSKIDFDLKYKHNSCYWRGKKVLDRNIIEYSKNHLNK